MPEVSKVTRILPPKDWLSRQIDTLKSVGEKNYLTGILMPRKDPIEAGMSDQAEAKFADQMKKVVEEKRRVTGLEGTDMGEWSRYAQEFKGRLVEGVTKREAKVNDFITTYQPLLVDHVSSIDVLPVGTDKEREDKMLENLRGLKALHGKAR